MKKRTVTSSLSFNKCRVEDFLQTKQPSSNFSGFSLGRRNTEANGKVHRLEKLVGWVAKGIWSSTWGWGSLRKGGSSARL